MTAPVLFGVGGAAFLLSMGVAMWWQAGPAVFAAFTEFGHLICGCRLPVLRESGAPRCWVGETGSTPQAAGKGSGMRLDQLLVERGLARTRSKAREAILRGAVTVDGAIARRPSQNVPDNAEIAADLDPYVRRGAHKLIRPDMVVSDVSFISLTMVLPPVVQVAAEGATLVAC